jgi:hypothetical protein
VGDTFVDLTYRGLALGRRVKLAQVRPSTAYLELPAPMPVGTTIGILTDDTVALDAYVVAIREQVAATEQPPGMVVKPRLTGEAEKAWWSARVTLPAVDASPLSPLLTPGAAVVLPKRTRESTGAPGVPVLVDDGLKTTVMAAVDPDAASVPVEQDDGRKTIAMSAVDLAALGLDPNARSTSGEIAAVQVEDDLGEGDGDGKSKKKKRKR